MIYDGVHRIHIVGEENSGRKCLVSAFLYKFLSENVTFGGNLWELSAVGEDSEMLEGSELLEENMKSYDVMDVFSMEKIFAGETDEVSDSLDLQLKIAGDFCGRLEFVNILGKNTYKSLAREECKAISAVLVLIDTEKFVNNKNVGTDFIRDELAELSDIYSDGFVTVFALTKIDVVPENDRENLCEKLKSDISEIVSDFGVVEVSSANKVTGEVFGEDGELLENPNFKPYGVEELLRRVIRKSTPPDIVKMQKIIDGCHDKIRRRKGVFNSEIPRAGMELEEARKCLCTAVRDIHPLKNTEKYITGDE